MSRLARLVIAVALMVGACDGTTARPASTSSPRSHASTGTAAMTTGAVTTTTTAPGHEPIALPTTLPTEGIVFSDGFRTVLVGADGTAILRLPPEIQVRIQGNNAGTGVVLLE